MEEGAPDDLRRVWRQRFIPVIVRRGAGHKLQVRIPGTQTSLEGKRKAKGFLQRARPGGLAPVWQERYQGWQLPQSWFSDLVEYLLDSLGKLYIIQPYRVQEKCASKCMNAEHHECQCSCMGANHGAGGPGAGWFEVSETFATKWGDAHLACRLMLKTTT